MTSVIHDDHLEAARVATAAGELLLSVRSEMSSRGADSKEMKDEGDRLSHEFIMAELQRVRPDDAILSEEGKDLKERLSAHRTWIVDPVDGTREFSEPPRTDWAVHVAMVVDGEPVVGAVGAPGLGLTSSTKQVPDLPDRADRRRIVVTGRTRVQVDGFVVANALDAELVACSSAGFKAMLVMGGHADVYVHVFGA